MVEHLHQLGARAGVFGVVVFENGGDGGAERHSESPWKANNVELYALMIGEFPVYTFKGFMRREDLLKEERLGNLGYGQTYIAQQHELCELSELMENEE